MLFVVFSIFLCLASCDTKKLFEQVNKGDATYYGLSTGGHCSISKKPNFAKNLWTVALNNPEYANSAGCGMCIRMRGEGPGLGNSPVSKNDRIVYVTDECPECKPGDLDISQSGDGRWDISWEAIDCPVGNEKIFYGWQGSHNWYIKLQVRAHRVPVTSVAFKPKGHHSFVSGNRRPDNFWECPNCPYPLKWPMELEIRSIDGQVVIDALSSVTDTTGNNQVQFAPFVGGGGGGGGGGGNDDDDDDDNSNGGSWNILSVTKPGTTTEVSKIPVTGTFDIDVKYEAKQSGSLIVDVMNGDTWKWYGGNSVSVSTGSGKKKISVTVADVPTSGNILVKVWLLSDVNKNKPKKWEYAEIEKVVKVSAVDDGNGGGEGGDCVYKLKSNPGSWWFAFYAPATNSGDSYDVECLTPSGAVAGKTSCENKGWAWTCSFKGKACTGSNREAILGGKRCQLRLDASSSKVGDPKSADDDNSSSDESDDDSSSVPGWAIGLLTIGSLAIVALVAITIFVLRR